RRSLRRRRVRTDSLKVRPLRQRDHLQIGVFRFQGRDRHYLGGAPSYEGGGGPAPPRHPRGRLDHPLTWPGGWGWPGPRGWVLLPDPGVLDGRGWRRGCRATCQRCSCFGECASALPGITCPVDKGGVVAGVQCAASGYRDHVVYLGGCGVSGRQGGVDRLAAEGAVGFFG